MSATATLSSKYQITIPMVVREALHWEAGQELVFIPNGKGVLVMPAPELAQLVGIAESASTQDYRGRQDRF
ncbi:AbrB/MazE/SpoVT family DNA-binding domain-containing protein [Perlucidibaca piscinae]|uniref:AbrB/MazE/SpoVT family DNA-binding domain-containing protein n=1 Tax=Perlucidibaca piscinae TaxID=392589 RepID=UPI000479B023|nr:AbrB/MazE/SpoVT family DNA-binding domain-containing protein [Perlucidibaca piscinae]